jgi:hypothetical protein
MIRIAAFCSILIFSCSYTYGQNLIGYKNIEIRKFMKENRKDMNYDKVRNSMFSYLKYSDNYDRQTILFFLTTDSVCKSIRVICDSTMRTEKIKELDTNYKRIADNSWVDDHDGKKYLITFKDEKWSCSITIVPDKQK